MRESTLFRAFKGAVAALVLLCASCGGSKGTPPPQPAELLPAGAYTWTTAHGSIPVYIDGEAVQIHDWRTTSQWVLYGGWHLEGRCWTPYGRAGWTLGASAVLTLSLGDRTIRGRLTLLTASG